MDEKTKLRQARIKKKLSLRHVADEVAMNYTKLSRVETGKATPSTDEARRLFDFYDGKVPLGEIYDPMFRFEFAGL